jgi:hypothetical protein
VRTRRDPEEPCSGGADDRPHSGRSAPASWARAARRLVAGRRPGAAAAPWTIAARRAALAPRSSRSCTASNRNQVPFAPTGSSRTPSAKSRARPHPTRYPAALRVEAG